MDSREIKPGGLDNGRGADSGQIKAEIDQTRERIDETLDALGEKLHPRHLLDEVLDYFRNPSDLKDTASRVGQGIWHQVQQHPMPSLLIGAGLAWLLSEKSKSREDVYYPRGRDFEGYETDADYTEGVYVESTHLEAEYPVEADYPAETTYTGEPVQESHTGSSEGIRSRARRKMASAGQSASHMAHSVKEKTGELAHHLKEKSGELTSSLKEKSGELTSSLREKSGEFTQNLKEKSMHQATRLKEATSRFGAEGKARAGAVIHRAEEKLSMASNEYPLALGLGFLAIGVLAGLGLPRTRMEDRTIGPRADELKHRVKEQGRQAVDTAKHAVGAAVGAATDTAKEEGLSPESLGEKVKHVAKEAVHAAKEAAHREGLDSGSVAQQVKHVAGEAKRAAQDEINRPKTTI